MPLVPRTSIVPPGGWHFVDRTGPQEVTISGGSDIEVSERILRYRLENSLPVGNPRQELIDSVCGPYPHFCVEETPGGAPETVAPTPPRQHMSRRVASWIASFYRSSTNDAGVSQGTAEARAQECVKCPLNAPYDQGGCGSCLDAIQRLSYVWRRNRETTEDKNLGGCAACGQHNATAVHAATLPTLSPAEAAELPGCWRRKL